MDYLTTELTQKVLQTLLLYKEGGLDNILTIIFKPCKFNVNGDISKKYLKSLKEPEKNLQIFNSMLLGPRVDWTDL